MLWVSDPAAFVAVTYLVEKSLRAPVPVPEITPVEESIENPVGKEVQEYTMAPPVASMSSGEASVPSRAEKERGSPPITGASTRVVAVIVFDSIAEITTFTS